jgi:hypothetical protein
MDNSSLQKYQLDQISRFFIKKNEKIWTTNPLYSTIEQMVNRVKVKPDQMGRMQDFINLVTSSPENKKRFDDFSTAVHYSPENEGYKEAEKSFYYQAASQSARGGRFKNRSKKNKKSRTKRTKRFKL